MRTKSSQLICLAAIAGAAWSVGSSASAAETPESCAATGPYAIYIEGWNTCVDPGGYLWAEGYYNDYADYPSKDTTTYGIATIGLTLDTVTDTGRFGDLKGYMDIRFQLRSAEAWSSAKTELEISPQTVYFEWAGITAGYRTSLFDFYANNDVQGSDPATIGDDTNLLLAAYTLNLPEGFGLTFSVEDSYYRKGGIDAADANSSSKFGQDRQMPDFVGALTQSGDWGSAQLSGALHRVKADTPSGFKGSTDPEVWGYAVQAGIMFNLPMITKGDTLYLQTAYSDGATTYLGLQNPGGSFGAPDAYISAGGDLSRVAGWNVTAQYLHNWTPTLNSAVFGGYGQFDVPTAEARSTYGASGGENINVGANLMWSPTDKVSLVAQYAFNRYSARDFHKTGKGMSSASQDAHEVLLMAQYNF